MLLLIYCLMFASLSAPSWSITEDGFCYNVNQMHKHCVEEGSTVPITGPKGEKGDQGIVDYREIDALIAEETSEIEAGMNTKISECEESLQQAHERIDQLEEKMKSLLITDCGKVTPEDAKWTDEKGGIFDIYISGKKTEVYCDLTTDGGGWLVFQRRINGSVDFYREWTEYVAGFGSKYTEFWLGLETLHRITSSCKYELRVDLEDWEGNKRFARYEIFNIGNEASNYRLTIGGYSGTATDSISRENGRAFSTKDRDHDTHATNCAVRFKGGWWYGACHEANLNGFYHVGGQHSTYADGINWRHWRGYHYSMKLADMKIRRLCT